MKKIILLALLALVAGCASRLDDYSRSETRVVQTVAYGTVESVSPARLAQHDGSSEGIVAGAVIGSILGEGGGVAGTLLGAVGGGFAGNAIQRSNTEEAQEIVVRLDDGSTIVVVQPGMEDFEPGHRVRVQTGPKGKRIEP